MLIPAVVILLITGCSAPKKISSWKAGAGFSRPYTKILILGVVRYAEMEIRENIEIKLEEVFQKKEIKALSSLRLLGATVFDRMDEEDVLYQLNNNCVDAVMTITLLRRSKENKYTVGLIYNTP